jgi:hypothetical protein
MTYPMTLIREHFAGSHSLTMDDLANIEKKLTNGRYQYLFFTQLCCGVIILATVICVLAKSVFAAYFLPFGLVALAVLMILERPEKIIKDLKKIVETLDCIAVKDKKTDTTNKRSGVHNINELDRDTVHIKFDIARPNLDKTLQDSLSNQFAQIEKMYLGLNKIEKCFLGSLHEGKEEYIPLGKVPKGHNWGPGHVLGDK